MSKKQASIQQIMIRQGINQLTIDPFMTQNIQVAAIQIASNYFFRYNDSVLLILKRIKEAFKVLNKIHSEITLSYLIKKIFFIHFFIRQTARNNILKSEVQQLIIQQIKQIQENITLMANPKRSKSAKKIISFVRYLSGFKDKSRMNMQNSNESHLLNDILLKNLLPYCHYLLQIIQDQEAYRAISWEPSNKDYRWKIIKWCIMLGDIVISLNKIGKYFVQQMLPIWLFMYYLISIDVSVFQSIIRQRIQNESLKWINELIINYKFYKINSRNKVKIIEILESDQLIQLKREIQQWMKLRQMFNHLYCNKFLTKWKDFFIKSKKGLNAGEQAEKVLNLIDQLCKKMNMKSINTKKRVLQPMDRSISSRTSIVKQSQQALIDQKRNITEDSLETKEQTKDQSKMQNSSLKQNSIIQIEPIRKNSFFAEKRGKVTGKG